MIATSVMATGIGSNYRKGQTFATLYKLIILLINKFMNADRLELILLHRLRNSYNYETSKMDTD